ncbi:unnamed protein product [Amaranthus hypochondriacus]
MANNKNKLEFTFDDTKEQRGDFRATSPYIMGDDSSEEREVRVRIFDQGVGESSVSSDPRFTDMFPFKGICKKELLYGKNKQEQVVGIAVDEFVPLDLWLLNFTSTEVCVELWAGSTRFRGFVPKIRKLGRLIGKKMYQSHVNGDYLGVSLPAASVTEENIFYDEQCKKLSGVTNPIQGMKYDVLQFGKFINQVVKLTKLNTQYYQLEDDISLVTLTQDLCAESQVNKLTTLKELQDLSYFVSHTPLFWEYDQRRDFSYAIYQLCKKFPTTIPKLQFHQQHKTNINPDWSNELSSLPQPYTDVYDHGMVKHLFCYTTKISLMFFHRNCHIHLKDYEGSNFTPPEKLDEDLQGLHPGIIPKTWYALYRQGLSIQPNLIEYLSCQPGKLNYNNYH